MDHGKISVGLIGAGGMGTRHAVNLSAQIAGARMTAIFDVERTRAEHAAALSGAPLICASPVELMSLPEVAAVIIASPDDTHAELTLECLRRGKPVLCEKPLATRPEDALRVIEAEKAAGRRLVSVGLMRRFDPYHVAVRDAVRSGRLGRPILHKGTHRNTSIPYDSRGEVIITNSSSHDVDAARWLLGQEVVEVFAQGVRSRASFSAETQDLILLQLRLTGDCLATVEVFAAAEYGYEVAAEVVCERGTALTGQPDYAVVREARARAAGVPFDWLERFEDAYALELQDWVRSIRSGDPFSGASAWDGYMALRITDACVRSLKTGQPVAVESESRPQLYRQTTGLQDLQD
jgi:myo-inositol 2-dehydrogenase/D-chiro-inositol 1-dehydrogenase